MAAATAALVGRLWTPDTSGAPEMGSRSRRQGEHESSDAGNAAPDDVEGGEAAVDLENDGITSATDAPPLPVVVVAAEDDDGIDDSSSPARTNNTSESRLRRHETVRNLRNLEEERESRRRRTSTCTLIAVFFLFRLWLEALASSDSSLLLVALLLTSWLLRFFQTNRETEEEIDRAIHEYIQRADEEEGGGILSRSAMARASAIENGDLRLMSFQAQLAIAILESRRQMMESGEDNGEAPEGLDDEAKSRWQRFTYRAELETSVGESSHSGGRTTSTSKGKERDQDTGGQRKKIRFGFPLKRGGYGSLPSLEHPAEEGGDDRGRETCKDAHDIDREPSCSICLCEYEEGDGLARVIPCGHTYHLQCIDAWAESHYRCPLCNYDMRGEAIV